MTVALNDGMLKGNNCFGCGPDNPDGLRIRIYRDGARTDRIVGVYRPRENMIGFPHIVHGGLQFTALDCMASWAVFALRAPNQTIPLTKSATTRYLRPAHLDAELALSAEITGDPSGPRDPLLIHAELRDGAGLLLTTADFEFVLLTQERFKKTLGLATLPDSYRRHFGEI